MIDMPSGVYKRDYSKIYTAERSKKISETKLKNNKLLKEKFGYVNFPETRTKMSIAKKGKRAKWLNPIERGKKISLAKRGKSNGKQNGENCHFWKGGIYPENRKIRSTLEYRLWRETVFKRDNYTCIWCGLRSGNGRTVRLNADHIKPFSLYPELRFAIDNGRTLCVDCHRKTDTYAGRIKSALKIN